MAKKKEDQLMEYIGEKGFTRASPDAYLNYVKCVKECSNEKEQKACFRAQNVYSKFKNMGDTKRGSSYFQRLGFVKKWKNNLVITKLGQELLNAAKLVDRKENWDFKIMKKIDFIFLKSIILLSHYDDSDKRGDYWQDFSIIRDVLANILKSEGRSWKQLMRESQPKKRRNNWKNKNLEKYIFKFYNKDYFIEVLTQQHKGQKIKYKNFWKKYFKLLERIINSSYFSQKNEWQNLIKDYRRAFKDYNMRKEQHNSLLLMPKTTKSNNWEWIEDLSIDDFTNLWNRNYFFEIITNLRFFYSENDYIGITLQNIKLGCKFLHFKSNKRGSGNVIVTIKDNYHIFVKKLVKHWDKLASELKENPNMRFNEFLKILNFKDQEMKHSSFKEVINKKMPELKVDMFLNLFADYKSKKDLIEKELKNNGLNESIKNYVWFEWFVGLKLIYLSNYKLDESIFNLKLDSNFEPHSTHAGGNMADMQGSIDDKVFIVEVTLHYGRNISKYENESVRNHIVKTKPKPNFLLFISPQESHDFNNIVKMDYWDMDGKKYDNSLANIKCIRIDEFLKFKNFFEIIS